MPGEGLPGSAESAVQAMEPRRRDYCVARPVLSQRQLEELGHRGLAPGTRHWRPRLRCSRARAQALLLQHLPVLAWLPQYPLRTWLLGDLLSGLSVAIMQLPQGLAYALLAGLPPVFGLYSSFYPVFIYFLFGTSRHISVGTFAVMSVMVGSVTESLAADEAFLQAENATVDETARDADPVQVASTLSVLVGLFQATPQVGLGLARFGFVVTYLSEPLVRGYTTAASVHVLVSQLKYVFGLHLNTRSGPLSLVYTVLEVCQKLPQSVVGTVVTAAVAGVGLAAVKVLNNKLQHRLPVPLPGELLTVSPGVGQVRRILPGGCPGPKGQLSGRWGIPGAGAVAEGPRRHPLPRRTAPPCPKWRFCLSRSPASPHPLDGLLQAPPVTPKVVSQSPLLLIGATGISYGVDLKHRFGVDVVGDIPAGLMPPAAPSPQHFAKLVGSAFTIAVVGFAIAISLGKIFALRHGYRVDSNQELVALGLSNLVGGIFQCFPVSCSMSRSLVQESAGGSTQVAGAVSSLFILVIIVKLGELFRDLPKAVLAATILVNLKGMLMQAADIRVLWEANRADLLIWLVTFVATILVNLDLGLGVAVAFSLLLVVVRTQLPRYSVLGQVPGTDIYRDVAEYSEATEVPGVKVFRSSATVFFANAELYSDALKQRCGVEVDHLISRKKMLLQKKVLTSGRHKGTLQGQAGPRPACLPRLLAPYFPPRPRDPARCPWRAAASKDTSVSIDVNTSIRDAESNGEEDCKAEARLVMSAGNELEDTAASGQDTAKAPGTPTLKALGLPQPDFHSLVLDLSTLSFVDTVCLKSLKNIFRDFREIEVEVYMAACHTPVVAQLEAGRFFDASISKQHLFASVHDAVIFAVQHPRSGPTSPVLVTKL
ncbi:hypothetical protein MC885_016476 [Smutsia gigantea]|nr:hypothetical protein MC885_016476 [Smutsia gigantea]